ncbi:MAG: hypothetical protein Q4A82_00265 [Corynebacterium sp.]|nr:hypothetical protein [Corynebacterium sp.]
MSNGYDPLAVAFYDIAHEGAQVRAIAGAIETSITPQQDEFGAELPGLASLAGVRARSIVVLCADNLSYRCAQLAASLVQPLPVALVITETAPGYLGALDVLIVLSEKGEDPTISRAISHAVSRGITTILVCPGECPMVNDAPRDTIIVPHLPNALGPSPTRSVVAVLAVLELADLDPLLVVQKLNDWATEIDEELEACSPERDETTNPARELAAIHGAIVHCSESIPGMALATVVATLWAMRGQVSASLSLPELAAASRHYPGAQQDIFYDPLLDDGPTLLPLKPVVWCAPDHDAPGLPGAIAVTSNSTSNSQSSPVDALRLMSRAFAATVFFHVD